MDRRALLSPTMDEILQRLTEVSIRQQQIAEHLATRQGETEQEIAAIHAAATAQRSPQTDPCVRAAQLLSKLIPYNNVKAFFLMFESTAATERWPPNEWAQALAPLLTGEAQRAYFALPAEMRDQYEAVKRKVLARMGLSSVCAAQLFHKWNNVRGVLDVVDALELADAAQQREIG
ncbi:hypothetical protein QQF64_008525 [Cirrhinus molitorella]|uniref:Uncharacterized protein n=1 Tax=Cirrhinus molitorella TaxID=172907 RepID=A0ABR3M6E5_9TELE